MKIIISLIVLAVIVVVVLLFFSRRSKQDVAVAVEGDDPEMTAAIAEARATLPHYWQLLGHPEHGESDFSLKVRISDGTIGEHFWAVDVEQKDGVIYGTIDNDPQVIKTVKIGQRIQIQEQDISDWGYVRNGKMYGKYTMRVILKRLPPEEAAKYSNMLSAEP